MHIDIKPYILVHKCYFKGMHLCIYLSTHIMNINEVTYMHFHYIYMCMHLYIIHIYMYIKYWVRGLETTLIFVAIV